MRYVTIPSIEWMKRKGYRPGRHVENWNDCDKIANQAMVKMSDYCIGMVVVKWSKGINHTMNIIVTEDEKLWFFDTRSRVVYLPDTFKIVGIWI